MDYQPILDKIRKEIEVYAHEGKQADYIPALARVNPDQFGLCLNTLDGKTYLPLRRLRHEVLYTKYLESILPRHCPEHHG